MTNDDFDRWIDYHVAALRRFLTRHGKPCPMFHAQAELGLSDERFLAAAERIGAVQGKWGFLSI